MSKMDNLRAMREAEYAAARKRSAGSAGPPKAPVAPPVAAAPKATDSTVDAPPAAAEKLYVPPRHQPCTCTRGRGRAAKSHRYS